MKIQCNREQLLAAFQTAAMVVPSRSPKPILQNVKLEAHGEAGTLMATDMEVGIRVNVGGLTAEVPGSALLSVLQFGSILRESTDETLDLETDGQAVTVLGQRSRFRFPSSDPMEFPHIAQFDVESYHTVAIPLMKELIRRTLFATDTESTRYALGGVLLEMHPESIIAVATDGRRLAKMEGAAQTVGEPTGGDTMTIVPARSMQLIERALSDSDGEVQIVSRGNDILIHTSSVTIVSRLVEGRFPRWREVVPDRPASIQIDLTAGPLHAALRQAAIVSKGESRGIDFTLGEGSLVLTGMTADVGESRVELPIPYDGESITLSLDHRYVSDFLRVLDTERTFQLDIVDGDSAALLKTEDGYECVVMPLARDRKKKEQAEVGAAE